MNKKKNYSRLLLALLLLAAGLVGAMRPQSVAAQSQPIPGSSLSWEYIPGTKTLTITGTGDMPDFAYADAQPWKDVRNEIEKVKIEAGVTSVGNKAFHACEKLTNITLPAGLERLGDGAFGECGALASITLPEGLQTIERNAFGECLALTHVTIPKSVTTIGDGAFTNCWKLASVTLPADAQLGTIGENAFYGCEKLASLTIPKSVNTIGQLAFAYCVALKDMTVAWTDAASIPVIQSNVFDYLNLGNIKLHVPAGKKEVYKGKDVWKELTIVEQPWGDLSTGLHWAYDDATRTLTISNPNPGTPKSMPDFADFNDQPWKDLREKKIKTVVIETGVTSIGNRAFTGCEVLTSVTLPESGLETIGEKAFMGCEKLSSITIPKSVTTIKEEAFYSCYALGGVTVEWTEARFIPNLPASAFSYPNGKVLHVPAGTAEMYKAKDEWKKFFIMDGKTAGGNFSTGLHWAYDDETKTLSITGAGEIPNYNHNALMDRPWNAFINKARTVTLAEGVTKIGERAFAEFHVLPSITLPKSVATIGEKAFENCHKLTDVTVPWTDNNIPIPDGNAFDLPGLVLHVPAGTVETYKTKDVWKRFFIMDGKTAGGDLSTGPHWEFNNETKTLSFTGQGEIPDYNNFEDRPWHAPWEKVQTVTLGEGVTKIGKQALRELKKMTSVTLPKSVTEIGERAFAFSKSLTNFTVAWKDAGSIPVIQANVFDDVTLSDVTLYVPEGMVDTYKAKNVWKDFDIQEAPPTLSAALTDAAPMASAAGSTKQIKVQGNKKWKATIPAAAQTWLEFAGGDGITIVSESPDTTLTVKAKNANGITAARTATLDFVFEDGSGPATPVTVAVTQVATPAPTPEPAPKPQYPETLPPGTRIGSLTLSASNFTLDGEKTFRFTVTIAPADATDKRLIVSSSDETVVRVRILPAEETRRGLRAASDPAVVTVEGTVYGIGKAKVNVKSTDGSGLNATCDVEVRSLPTANIEASAARIYTSAGRLYLSLPTATRVEIYSLLGTLLRGFTAPAGTSSVALPAGMYVVRTGNRAEKVVVN